MFCLDFDSLWLITDVNECKELIKSIYDSENYFKVRKAGLGGLGKV